MILNCCIPKNCFCYLAILPLAFVEGSHYHSLWMCKRSYSQFVSVWPLQSTSDCHTKKYNLSVVHTKMAMLSPTLLNIAQNEVSFKMFTVFLLVQLFNCSKKKENKSIYDMTSTNVMCESFFLFKMYVYIWSLPTRVIYCTVLSACYILYIDL